MYMVVMDGIHRTGAIPVLHQLVQVLLHVFEYEEEMFIFSDDLLQFDHVDMVELFQGLKGQVGRV